MKLSPVVIFTLAALHVANAAPQNCKDMANRVAQKFAAEKRMVGPSQAKCQALSLVISDLTDLATACTRKPEDDRFLNETYMPLAKAIGEEAPNACSR
jgi:hypothetical protein